jgi:hypothetical protein
LPKSLDRPDFYAQPVVGGASGFICVGADGGGWWQLRRHLSLHRFAYHGW